MNYKIEKAAVIGAGVMGSGIAAHLANAGIPTYLLDIVLPISEDEKQKGIKETDKAFRDKLALMGKEKAIKSKPAALFSPKCANLITCGNVEDDINVISNVNWVIEVVKEDMNIKKEIFKKIHENWKEGIIVSSNTSGLSINGMCEGLSEEFKKHFLGTHFFNPVRYMKLLEIIPGEKTSKEVINFISEFGERRLGKGIVFCKDTPNFIGNRIGIYGMMITIKTMLEMEMRLEEVDAIYGPPMGRPKSAVFRTADIVGLDTLISVAKNVYNNLPSDPERDVFTIPEFMNKMVEQGLLGDKAKSGFYKVEKSADGEKKILSLDYKTLNYTEQQKPDFPSIKSAKGISDTAQRIKAIINGQDKASEFAWKVTSKTLLYAIKRIPEISDDIVNIDNAMKWGYNWTLGPFEVWDAIGVKESVERMKKDGEEIPKNLEKVLSKGGCFYKKEKSKKSFFDIKTSKFKVIKDNPKIINLNILKEEEKVIDKNAGASLIDIGDGVACLQFHSALQPDMNPIDDDTIAMINKSIEIVKKDFIGLVIANHGTNFCVGANLMLILVNANQKKWDVLDKVVRDFQNANMALKLASFPVVAAPHQLALGGGCEICLHADRVRPAAETYIGLVEVGVGLIPAGGGCKEMLIRAIEGIPDGVETSLTHFVGKAFQTIATAKVATSAKEAIDFGILRNTDKPSINSDYRIYDAKQTVINMVNEGYEIPQEKKDIKVPGRDGYSALSNVAWVMQQGKYATEYDVFIAKKVAYILCGGDVSTGSLVSEQYILDLEREAFLSLLGQEKTKARIQHMLTQKKPLRN